MFRRFGRLAVVSLLAGIILAPAVASANDHLADAVNSAGADNRGFDNPVTQNPSGTSGAAAQPGTVPGQGNPNAGADQGTPSVSQADRCLRLTQRSNGDGNCP